MLDTQVLLDRYFETAFAAPDGIKRLRELILSLAMRGKLVPQDPNDRPASELLKEIEAEKKLLIKEGKIKNSKPLPEITADEIPYDLPDSWEWVRLGDITEIVRGITFSSTAKTKEPAPNRVPCLRTANVQEEIEWNDLLYIDKSYVKRQDQIICKDDIIMSMANSKELVGKVAIIKSFDRKVVTFGGFLSAIRIHKILPYFILNFLRSNDTKNKLIESSSQTTNIANISLSKLKPLLVPLPPLEEQRRIVEKIDRLMEKCDRLEQLRTEREKKRLIVHAAASHKLLNPKGDQDFKEAWKFINNSFGDLYAVKENISELRKAILQLAVMGKLVPQDPNDPPARELLKEIEAEKQRLIKEGKIKKQKPLPEITLSEIPYQIPESWIYTSIDNLFIVTGGIQKTGKRTPINNHYPYLGVTNVQRGYLNLYTIKRFELIDGELEKYSLQKNDLLIVEGNGSPNEIGRCAIWQNEIDSCVHQNHLIRCRPFNKEISNYVLMVLNSPFGINEMQLLAVTTSGLYTLSVSKIRGIHLLLPPLPEQQRIVEKVDQLMKLCDQL